MSQTRMRHLVHTNVPFHKYEWVILHMPMCHVVNVHESPHAYQCAMSWIRMRHLAHVVTWRVTWLMSRVTWMSHVTRHVTCINHIIWMSHVTRTSHVTRSNHPIAFTIHFHIWTSHATQMNRGHVTHMMNGSFQTNESCHTWVMSHVLIISASWPSIFTYERVTLHEWIWHAPHMMNGSFHTHESCHTWVVSHMSHVTQETCHTHVTSHMSLVAHESCHTMSYHA